LSVQEGYATFALVWSERQIMVSFQQNWLNSRHWHIELRCDEPLPVTTTGYRSHFVPDAAFADQGEIVEFVQSWLDTAASRKPWQTYLAESRQLKRSKQPYAAS
jgi:hypothetical protein